MRQPDIHIADILCDKASILRCCKFPRNADTVSSLNHHITLFALLLIGIHRVMAQIPKQFFHLPLTIPKRQCALPAAKHLDWLVDPQPDFLYLLKFQSAPLPVPPQPLRKKLQNSVPCCHAAFPLYLVVHIVVHTSIYVQKSKI